jgi:8-oxoguanine deaminase
LEVDMTTMLVKNASTIVTMDDSRHELMDASFFINNGFFEQIGSFSSMPETADTILDLEGYIVFPGLINTHHHFYQTLTRCIPGAQNSNLFNWLKTLYPIWSRITPNDIFISTQTALAELALSGCSTASDHLYIFPNGTNLADEIIAANEVGLRLHASRGSMSLGESQGGLPPDELVEKENYILQDCLELIQKYHDPSPGSKIQLVLAPCSPFSVTADLMTESANLAREYQVFLHTHLAETQDESEFCFQNFGYLPVDYMNSLGWTGNDVWFAHTVHLRQEDIGLFSKTGIGVAHCPSSNMRLASGIAPVMKMIEQGVKVGIGVDGSASNDTSHMLFETRQAMLLARLNSGILGASLSSQTSPPLMTARQALELATRGGASVLGRKDIGTIENGKCADFAAVKLDHLEFSGANHDPVAALVFCTPLKVDYLFVGGKMIVDKGELTTVDLPNIIERHNKASKRLISQQ